MKIFMLIFVASLWVVVMYSAVRRVRDIIKHHSAYAFPWVIVQAIIGASVTVIAVTIIAVFIFAYIIGVYN